MFTHGKVDVVETEVLLHEKSAYYKRSVPRYVDQYDCDAEEEEDEDVNEGEDEEEDEDRIDVPPVNRKNITIWRLNPCEYFLFFFYLQIT